MSLGSICYPDSNDCGLRSLDPSGKGLASHDGLFAFDFCYLSPQLNRFIIEGRLLAHSSGHFSAYLRSSPVILGLSKHSLNTQIRR